MDWVAITGDEKAVSPFCGGGNLICNAYSLKKIREKLVKYQGKIRE